MTVHPLPSDSDIHWIDIGDSNIGAERTFSTPHWNNHVAMVKYTIAMLQAMVGTNTTGPRGNINKRPIFSTLWHIKRYIFDGLHKVGNIQFPLDCHADYILSKEAFALF